MNSSHFQESSNPVTSSLKSMMESANALVGIVSGGAGDLFRIQSSSSQAGFNAITQRLASTTSPDSWAQLVWQSPDLYQKQTLPHLENLLDSFTVLTRCQQQLLEWSYQVYSSQIQHVSNALSQFNEALMSRRVSAEIINFADRRATSQRQLEKSSVKTESPASPRATQHATA